MNNGQNNGVIAVMLDTLLQLFNAGSSGTGSQDGGGLFAS